MSQEQTELADLLKGAMRQNDDKLVLEILEQSGSLRVCNCLVDEPTLFVRICAKGYVEAARVAAIDCGSVINMAAQLEGRTALQWACLLGYLDIVELLLPYVSPSSDVWRETSEFYSASLGGHIDVVRELTSQYPDLVADIDVRTALLYAACSGGNVQVVQFWYVPNMDINRPVELVSNLHNCENLVPLYAACEGNHMKVAKFLMENHGAEITEHIAQQFPELTASLIESVYSPLYMESLDSDDSDVKYRLNKANVHMVHPEWLKPWLDCITHLDLSENRLRYLPACLPWAMPNLISFNVAHNRLTRLASPARGEELQCDRLEEMLLSHNELSEVGAELFHLNSLTLLDLSFNHIARINSRTATSTVVPAGRGVMQVPWECVNLVVLNLSHNKLDVLTGEISGCSSLKKLNVSHNRLYSLPSPWPCSLEYLDASHNCLERFPSTTEQFWSGSLTTLLLNNNCLDQLVESILKLGMLQRLDVSHNQIQFLASPHAWDCPSLSDMNLSHNKLGRTQKQPEFPDKLLVSLNRLNLSDNELTSLPVSICALKNLVSLDISNNPLQDLPPEMGNLMECWDLKLQGLNLKKADLQQVVKSDRPQDVIHLLRKQLRKAHPCHILKTIVLGPQGKGKSTVVRSLVEGSISPVTVSDKHITRSTYTFKVRDKEKVEKRKDSDRPEVTLRLWELPGQPEVMALHPVFWTENSLFLLVWDVTVGISQLDHWLSGIQARLARVGVILVATFRDRVPSTVNDKNSKVDQFHSDINQLYGHVEERVGVYPKDDVRRVYPRLCSVVVVSLVSKKTFKQDLASLKRSIYFAALSMNVSRDEFLIGQQVPLSYIKLDAAFMQLSEKYENEPHRPPFLMQSEFDALVHSFPESDFSKFGDLTDALKLCCQTGSVLHYDVWPEGLRGIYFLGPDWLACMIAEVLKPSGCEAVVSKLAMQQVHYNLFSHGLPSNILRPFLQLLRHFDIGTPISEQGEDRLLIPCHLPRQAPGLQLTEEQRSRRLLRFYALPHVPDRLWARLILDLLLAVERLSQLSWRGVKLEKLRVVYWQTGLNITYSGGSVVIESATFHSQEEEYTYPGILISILPDSASRTNLAVVGFVCEEVDSAIQNIFPHHSDRSELFGTFALCPVCFDHVRPGEGIIRAEFRHFAVPQCAGSLLGGDFIRCYKGNYVPLEDLVPEFLMTELPEKLHISVNELQISPKKLGIGAAGSVYKGTLRGQEVAVKVFYSDSKPGDMSPTTTDSGTSSLSSAGSQSSHSMGCLPTTTTTASGTDGQSTVSSTGSEYWNWAQSQQPLVGRQDSIDRRYIKVSQAFTELRQETVILSQLCHPCLISLLGVSIRPSLLVAIELAPLGSLRSVIKKRMENRKFNKYVDRDKTFASVLDKDITFKIVNQIAVGLEYLHARKILYRDLKTDNLLVCSLDPKDIVNIKISDYGISKFAAAQITGMVGTPGYMAPEIMEGQVYDQKIDIFSFSMVIYETLCGHAPFESCERLHQIHQLVNYEKHRPVLKEYNVISYFPFLEEIMHDMWAHEASERPSARDVVRSMEEVGFVLQHSHITASDDYWARETGLAEVSNAPTSSLFCNITCAWASRETSSLSGRNTCWLWEYPTGLPHDRRLSVYNLASSQYHMRHRCLPGQPVTCMAKVGSFVWVGVMGGSIEVFGNSCTDVPKRKALLERLEADPVAIVHDKHNPNKELPEGEGLVYVGLLDGTVHIYHHYRWFRGVFTHEWKHWKVLTVSSTHLSAMCLVPAHHELWVACGHSLVIISTSKDALLVERRICVLKDMLPHYRDKVTTIQGIVRNDNSLWCSFLESPLIVEYDLHADVLSGAYCIESDIEVDITAVQLPRVVDGLRCQDCQGFASTKDPGGRSSRHGMLADTQKDEPPPPPRPPKARKDGMKSVHSGRQSDLESVSETKKVSAASQPADQKGLPSPSTDDVPPPLPPRSGRRPVSMFPDPAMVPVSGQLTKQKSSTMPDLRFPSSPPRRSLPSEHEGVYVQSLLAVEDTLWVGSSCGELLVIGAQNHYQASARPCLRCQRVDDSLKRHTSIRIRAGSLKKRSCVTSENSGMDSAKCDAAAAAVKSNMDNTSAVKRPGKADISRDVRLTLNLGSQQMCNLKSSGLCRANRQRANPNAEKSGGVSLLLQAQNLVVAVRNVSQETQARELAEISVWEACSTSRITDIRHYWQSLRALKAQLDKTDT